MKTAYAAETLLIAEERTRSLAAEVLVEVDRLLTCSGSDDHSRGLVIGVAIENMADRWLNGVRGSKGYKTLKNY